MRRILLLFFLRAAHSVGGLLRPVGPPQPVRGTGHISQWHICEAHAGAPALIVGALGACLGVQVTGQHVGVVLRHSLMTEKSAAFTGL